MYKTEYEMPKKVLCIIYYQIIWIQNIKENWSKVMMDLNEFLKKKVQVSLIFPWEFYSLKSFPLMMVTELVSCATLWQSVCMHFT